jgi:hypothetical protein
VKKPQGAGLQADQRCSVSASVAGPLSWQRGNQRVCWPFWFSGDVGQSIIAKVQRSAAQRNAHFYILHSVFYILRFLKAERLDEDQTDKYTASILPSSNQIRIESIHSAILLLPYE